MQYLALVSFSGKITMSKGKVGEISDQSLVDDLLKAGYIIPFEADKPTKSKPKEEPKKEDKPKKRKGKSE